MENNTYLANQRLFCLDGPLLEEVLERLEKRMGFKVTGQRIDVYGYCKRCSRDLDK